MNRLVVQCSDLSVRMHRTDVLRSVDLTLEQGKILGLLGRNGAGKSTLLRVLLGIERRQRGSVSVLDLDPQRCGAKVRTQIGYVPDRPDLYDWMTAMHAARFYAPFYRTWSEAEFERLCTKFHVPRAQCFRTMSRGEKAKLQLAIALAIRPRLLLLDEPFGGLDPVARDEMLGSVLSALRDDGCSILLVSHELHEVVAACDTIAILHEGRIVMQGAPEELSSRVHRLGPELDFGAISLDVTPLRRVFTAATSGAETV